MIINFNLQKISVERKADIKPNTNVEAKNNLKIEDIQEQQLKPLTTEKALTFSFKFVVTYDPQLASVEMLGNILYMTDEATAKEILVEWKKNKKINPKYSIGIINYALAKCNIRALRLEQEVSLPPHVPFPRIAPKQDTTGK